MFSLVNIIAIDSLGERGNSGKVVTGREPNISHYPNSDNHQ
jgi:hypothetical protein